jgi:glycosyltransferase involved in cell wall biosynthesis
MERWVAKRAQLTIVNSRVVQQWCEKYGIHRTVIIRHGVDLSRFKVADRERKYITFTGGMEVNDGVLLIPQAAQEVLKEFPDEMFMMVGDGKDRENLRQRVEELNLTRSFVLKGWMDQGKIPGILAESKIGLITMLKVSATELSTRLSSYEYMASGVPFVTSDLDCSQEQAQESNAGILFENGNPQKLAQGILQLLRDKTLWNTLSQNGQRYVKEHADWRQNAWAICLACEKVASEEKID